jgi:hypothetical protein
MSRPLDYTQLTEHKLIKSFKIYFYKIILRTAGQRKTSVVVVVAGAVVP